MFGEYDGVVDELESGQLYWLKNLLEERVSYVSGGYLQGNYQLDLTVVILSYWVCEQFL